MTRLRVDDVVVVVVVVVVFGVVYCIDTLPGGGQGIPPATSVRRIYMLSGFFLFCVESDSLVWPL